MVGASIVGRERQSLRAVGSVGRLIVVGNQHNISVRAFRPFFTVKMKSIHEHEVSYVL